MLDQIEFHSEDVDFEPQRADILRFWINETIQNEAQKLGEALNFIFCSDEYLYELNMQYLQHDTYTDVISFPAGTDKIEGDIFISIERVRENAEELKISFEQELHRVIIHGVLHFCGYDDLTDEDEAAMRAREDFYLQRLPK